MNLWPSDHQCRWHLNATEDDTIEACFRYGIVMVEAGSVDASLLLDFTFDHRRQWLDLSIGKHLLQPVSDVLGRRHSAPLQLIASMDSIDIAASLIRLRDVFVEAGAVSGFNVSAIFAPMLLGRRRRA